MHDGEVIRITNFRNYFVPGRDTETGKEVGLVSVGYKAEKGQVFVAVLLGVEPKDGSAPLDLEATLNSFGWVRKEDAEGKP